MRGVALKKAIFCVTLLLSIGMSQARLLHAAMSGRKELSVTGLVATLCASVLGCLNPYASSMDEAYPCDPIPAGATPACTSCLDEACDQYQQDLLNCGSSAQCKAAAKAAYRLQKSLCDCDPSAAILIAVLPEAQQHLLLNFMSQKNQ